MTNRDDYKWPADELDATALFEAGKSLCKHTGLFINGFDGAKSYTEAAREKWRHEAIAAAECVVRAYLAASVKAGEVVAWPGQLFDLLGAKRIMLVCQSCEQNNPEGCGHFTADTLRLSRDGSFVCESCWDDLGDELRWIDLPTITAAPDRSALVVEPVKGEPVAHRKMTREEYNALNLKGWHSVRHDEECEGVTEVSYTAPTTPERP